MSVDSQKPLWVTHFKIDDVTWNNLLKEAEDKGISVLAAACESGTINEQHLLRVEQAAAEIPIVSGSYFATDPTPEAFTGFDFGLFKKLGVLPLSKWEGHPLFAKLSHEAPETSMISFEGAIFVLAPWSGMKKWFDLWEKQGAPQDTPQGLKVETNISALSSINFADIKIDSQPPKTQVPQPQPEAKVQMQPEVQPPQPFQTLQFEMRPQTPQPPAPPQTSLPTEKPEPITQVQHMPPQLVDLDTSIIPMPAPSTSAAPVMPAPPPPAPFKPGIQAYPNIPLPDLNAVKATGVASQTTGQRANVAAIPQEQVTGRAKLAQTQDDICLVILSCWKNFFERSMVFSYQDGKLQTIKWEGNWTINDPTQPVTINLSTPSIFKIAIESGHSYHGFIMPSQVNQEFFNTTNGGAYPDHVTITTINEGDKIVGLILGICSKPNAQKINLNQLEGLSDTFSDHFKRIHLSMQNAG